jgi:hypothetical protein
MLWQPSRRYFAFQSFLLDLLTFIFRVARIFADDNMAAVAQNDGTGRLPAKSALVLAVLQDSSWYTANFDIAERGTWGRYQGCAFAMGRCVTVNQAPSHPFCRVANDPGCSDDYLFQGKCNLATYPAPLPTQFQYFPDHGDYGGPLPQMVETCSYYCVYAQQLFSCRITALTSRHLKIEIAETAAELQSS